MQVIHTYIHTRFRLLFLILFYTLTSVAQDSSSGGNSQLIFPIGETLVTLKTTCYAPCPADVLFVNVHDNENTCMIAAEQVLCTTGGKVVSIENCDERLVTFNFEARSFRFDPNRIYSQEGIKNTMTALSPCYDLVAANEVAAFAFMLLETFLSKTSILVTLHNNTDSDLSVTSYRNDQLYNRHSGETFVNPALDPDDFFLTTNTYFFGRLKEQGFNVVLENADLTKDDGSMSIYAGKKQIPYVNVEAQHEHVAEQIDMLLALTQIISDYKNLD